MLNLVAWNVNGYSDTIHAWLTHFLERTQPDIVFLSETKKPASLLKKYLSQLEDYHHIINAHVPSQWHGVVMLIKKVHSYHPLPIAMKIPTRKDTRTSEAGTGRLIAIELNGISIVGSYTPNSGSAADRVKFNYRINIWDPAFAAVLEILRGRGPVIVMGDLNVAPSDDDLSNPEFMHAWPGCSPQERLNFDTLVQGHWIDTWRSQHPDESQYTWVGSLHLRDDYGMRLDHVLVSDDLVSRLKKSYIVADCSKDTDHLPVGLYLSPLTH